MSVARNPKTGKWYAKFRYHDDMGRNIQKKKEGFRTKAEARRWEAEFITMHDGTSSVLFRCAFERYLEDSARRVKPLTLAGKRRAFRCFFALYELRLCEITAQTIRTWQNKYLLAIDKSTDRMVYTRTTIRLLNTHLSMFFSWCTRFCGLKSNPVCEAGRITYKGLAEKFPLPKGIWQREQFREFYSNLESEEYRLIYNLLFWCGLRRGEVLGIRVKDVDVKRGILHVRKNRVGRKQLNSPKTKHSVRDVSLPTQLVESIQSYIGRLDGKPAQGLLFPEISPSDLTSNFRLSQERLGISPRIRLHDLRHSHASMLINAGYSPDVVADRLGHKNAKMVLEIYGHMYPQKRTELTVTLDKLYDG